MREIPLKQAKGNKNSPAVPGVCSKVAGLGKKHSAQRSIQGKTRYGSNKSTGEIEKMEGV